jgi:hypothetical protein
MPPPATPSTPNSSQDEQLADLLAQSERLRHTSEVIRARLRGLSELVDHVVGKSRAARKRAAARAAEDEEERRLNSQSVPPPSTELHS